jgi:4-carboxymuconolactone decarboxylase
MTRLPPLPPEGLDPAQRAVYEAITGGRRGGGPSMLVAADGSLLGPFGPMVRSPLVGQAVQRLGELVRYEADLRPDVRELAILTVAGAWRSDFEWWAHAGEAARAGLPGEVIAALRAGSPPAGLDPQQAAAYELCVALERDRRVPEALYARAREHLGEQGVADLAFLFGYYTLVAATLATFEIGPPAEGGG